MFNMKLKRFSIALLSTYLIFSVTTNAIACTVLAIFDTHGNVYQGRTNEFAGQQPDSMMYLPAGTRIESVTQDGKPGATFDTKYGVLGVFLSGPFDPAAKNPTVHEAVNDQGMTLTTNALIENDPPIPTGPADKILSALDAGMWALGNFATVKEVKQAINNKEVEIWLPRIESMANFYAPLHFALYDKEGGAIVIEFTNGKTEVYDNPVRVLTNDPPFPWHLTNMNNYAYLTNIDKNSGQFNGLKVAATDSGGAQAGLPGIETSVGRFVKAAYYSNFVEKAQTPDQALITLSHVMNNFDRPKGISADLPGTASRAEAVAATKISSEATYFTVMNDLSRHHFYIRTINSINYTKFDVKKLSALKEKKVVKFSDINAFDRLDATELFFK
jgi:choloylglycine hydrolase